MCFLRIEKIIKSKFKLKNFKGLLVIGGLILTAMLSSYSAEVSYHQGLLSGIVAQREWLSWVLMIYPLYKWYQEKKITKRGLNTSILYVCRIYAVVCVLQYFLYDYTELGEMIDTYNNPLVVIQAICMFEFFVNLEIKTKRFNIDMFSKTALMVYLITDYPEIRQYIFLPMIAVVRKFNMPVIWIIINAIVIVLIVTLITWLNDIIMVRILKKIDRQYQD